MGLVILATILIFQTKAYIINNNNISRLNEVSQPNQYIRSHNNTKSSKLFSSQQVCSSPSPASTSTNLNESTNSSIKRGYRTRFHINSIRSTMDDNEIEEYDEEDDYVSEYDTNVSDDLTDYASDVDTPEPFEYNSHGELYIPAIQRLQRRRYSKPIRKVFRETLVNTSNLILPIIVHSGPTISGNDGITVYSPEDVIGKIMSAKKKGITTFLLIPRIEDNLKNPSANEGYNHEGMFPLLIADVKDKIPNVNIIADANVSNYTKDGHDGLVTIPGKIDNDATVQQVARQAVILAEAGADMISISDILDGTTSITREILDMEGFTDVGLISHVAKYSSTLLNNKTNENDESTPVDKMSYLNDPSNSFDVLMKLTELTASDAVVIEPSMLYMDLISSVKKSTNLPVIAYQTLGEFKLIKTANAANIIPEKNFVFEYLKSCIRSGANMIITHYAFDVVQWLQDDLQQNDQLNSLDSPSLVPSEHLSTGFLDNGMEYVLYPHSNPIGSISAYLEIHSGSVDEMDNQLGIAHFCEHITYMGSRKRQTLLRHSIKTNAFTDFHHTVFYATTCNSSHLKSIFEALDDVLRGDNQFTSERLEKERAAILSEASIIDTMDYRKNCITVKTLHSDNSLCQRFPIGNLKQLSNYQIDHLKSYHLENYTPRNSTIFLIGDVDSSILPLLNDTMGQFNRTGRVKIPCNKRIGHNFDKKTEFNVWNNPAISHVSCELLRKQPIQPITTLNELRLNILRKIILRGLSFNFDICHRGSSYIMCNANDFDCVNEGCRIQNISVKSNESNWKIALNNAIDHLHGMNFNSFMWNNLVSSQILETNKLLPENLQLKDLVPLIMEYWSCGHILMDLKDFCHHINNICNSLEPNQAQDEFERMFQWIDNPHAVLACTSNNIISNNDLKYTLANIIQNKNKIQPKPDKHLAFDSLITKGELNDLKIKSNHSQFRKFDHTGVSVYDFSNGCTVSYKNLKLNDNSFHIKIAIPIGNRNTIDGELLLATHTMMEGGAIASKTREQVEMYCCSNLINVNIDMENNELINISLSANSSMLEPMLQLSHYLLSECKLEKDAFDRAKLKLKTMLYDLKTNLQDLSLAQSTESIYPNRSLLSLTNEMIDGYQFETIQQLFYNVVRNNKIHLSLVGPATSLDNLLNLYIGTIDHKSQAELENKATTTPNIINGEIVRPNRNYDSDTRAAVTFSGFSPNGNGLLPNGESIFERLRENGFDRPENTSIVHAYGILIQELLGARAFANLREEQKLTYETIVNVNTPINHNCGLFTITVNCIPQNIDKVISAGMNMLNEIRNTRPFTPYQLDRVKSQLLDPIRLNSPTHWLNKLNYSLGRKSFLDDFIAKVNTDELAFVFNNLYGTSKQFIHTIVVTMK